MKKLLLIALFPSFLFAQTKQERVQKSKARVDSLLTHVEKTSEELKQSQHDENKRHADSLLSVVNHLANSLDDNKVALDKPAVKADEKQYYIVIGVYANQKLASDNKSWHKLELSQVVKSRGGKFYYLAIPSPDGKAIGRAVEKYKKDNHCDAWWVKL